MAHAHPIIKLCNVKCGWEVGGLGKVMATHPHLIYMRFMVAVRPAGVMAHRPFNRKICYDIFGGGGGGGPPP